MGRKILLACGALSSLDYLVATLLGALQWPAYSSVSQSVSELMAIEAPSRPIVTGILTLYAPFILAFAGGLWLTAGSQRSLRILAGIVAVYGILNLFAGLFPMHLLGATPEMTFTDKMHIFVTFLLVLFIFLLMGVGATALGKGFRLYSIVTIGVVLLFGALAGRDGFRMAAHLPTPWLGVTERVNIFGFQLWFAVLSIRLMGEKPGTKSALR